MIGPKLEARSYTNLLLIALILMLALNLFAQRTIPNRNSLSNEDDVTRSEVSASLEVASATREVARANQAIADAIKDLSRSVGALEMNVNVAAPGSGSSTPAASRARVLDPRTTTDGSGPLVEDGDAGSVNIR
ncbi:MAG: hypothetical protein RLY93_06105 [Sumerlaeia bacterium]